MVTKISGTGGVTTPSVTSVGSVTGGDFNMGVVGACRQLRAFITSASSSLQFLSQELCLTTMTGGMKIVVGAIDQTLNVSTVGPNGMDVGQAPVSGFVAVYAIYNPTTKATRLLAVDTTATWADNVYAGSNMPAGYTYSALISVWPTDVNRLLVAGRQDDRIVWVAQTELIAYTTAPTSPASVVSAQIPYNARTIKGFLAMYYVASVGQTTANISMDVSGSIGRQIVSGYMTSGQASVMADFEIGLAYQRQFWTWANSAAVKLSVFMSGYTI